MEFVSQNRFCLHLEPELKIREIKFRSKILNLNFIDGFRTMNFIARKRTSSILKIKRQVDLK